MSQVTLVWNANADPNVSYSVFRGTSSDNEGPLPLNSAPLVFGPGVQPTFTDTTVLVGNTYFYRVAAFKSGLESPFSNEVETISIPFPPGVPNIPLGRASGFGVLAATTITNTGPSEVRGDIGVTPGTSIVGFDTPGGPGFYSGSEHLDDFVALAAQADALAAFNTAMKLTNVNGVAATNLGTGADIGGKTLAPGVYSAPDSLAITGNVILDANGNADAVWVFQIGTSLTMATAAAIILRGGAQPANVYWIVGSSATIGIGSSFSGILIAKVSITLVTGANVDGQLLALTGAVTMDDNNIAMFIPITLILDGRGIPVAIGDIFFDCATGTFQEAIVGGITSTTVVAYNPVIGGTTQDGTVTWQTLDPPIGSPLGLPPSQPVPPPTAPLAPTGLAIKSES